jgi:selenocysteine lyase/cysteine desulfurase
MPSRRQLLKSAAGAPLIAAPGLAAPGPLAPNSIPVADLPSHYDVTAQVHNLEAGFWSPMPRLVAQDFARNHALVNRDNSLFGRSVRPGPDGFAFHARAAQAAIARQVGAQPQEIAITRSGSDALQMLITNYKPLKPGDGVICCDLDYDSTLAAMSFLESRRGAKLVKFAMPEPATTANILAAYDKALKDTPHARLLLVTLISHRTGLVTPVREIVAMARARGVDTIVDIAHGVALLDFHLDDLGADFAGWSVHKWTSAPLGTGAMYIRKNRLADIEPAFGNFIYDAGDINARVPEGTVNFANLMTIPKAVEFHFAVGAAAKERQMRALRDRWVQAVRDLKNVEILVPDDPARYCAITSFRLKGMDTLARAKQLQAQLLEKHNVLTIWREGVASGPVIRVTPGLYSTNADAAALAAALRIEHAMFA